MTPSKERLSTATKTLLSATLGPPEADAQCVTTTGPRYVDLNQALVLKAITGLVALDAHVISSLDENFRYHRGV
ncbi:MAG: hypothetical protein WBW73_14290 [Rhodoplanes sp.]